MKSFCPVHSLNIVVIVDLLMFSIHLPPVRLIFIYALRTFHYNKQGGFFEQNFVTSHV